MHLLSLNNGHEGDAESVEASAHDQQVHGITAQSVDLVDPQLLETPGNGVLEESSTVGPLGYGDGA